MLGIFRAHNATGSSGLKVLRVMSEEVRRALTKKDLVACWSDQTVLMVLENGTNWVSSREIT